MKKANKIINGVLAVIFLFGLFIGPVGWYKSASAQQKLHALQAKGVSTTAIIDAKQERRNFRVSFITVDVHFTDKETQKTVFKKRVNVNSYYYKKLNVNDRVPILYSGEELVLVDDFNWENLPPIKKPYWGMIYTLLSVAYILIRIIQTRRKRTN